jgi:Zn-dependent peptidase ImmA (M78 family)
MRVRRKHIRSLVERLLTNSSIHSAPVPVENIAHSLGIEVRRQEAEDELSGFLLRDRRSARATIGVNSSHHENRQRFSIAHEIGHFLLHAGQNLHVDGRTDAALTIIWRDDESSTGSKPEEIEANFFAAELLMPALFLRADLKGWDTLDFLDGEELDKVLVKLAKKYKVSRSALTYRLVNLNYVHL